MKSFKRYIPVILLILHCGLIFFLAAQDGESSTAISHGVVGTVAEATQNNTEDMTVRQMNRADFIVRKAAHFVLFMVLGVYACLSADVVNIKRKKLIALLFCIVYAMSDELHQLFSDGRSGQVTDVIIDFCGSFLGVMLTAFVTKLIKDRTNYEKS